MLSIQMCPLVPCTKKPSITTYHSQEKEEEEEEGTIEKRRGGRGRRRQDVGEGDAVGWRQIENGDKRRRRRKRKMIKT